VHTASNGLPTEQMGDATPTAPYPPEARDLAPTHGNGLRSRITARKYKIPRKQCPDRTAASSVKRTASRFYQLETGYALAEQYLEWTKNRPDAKCGWCQYKHQTREHLFKNCPKGKGKGKQEILWAEVRKETGRGKDRFSIRDLFADERCSQAVLDFIAATRVGRRVPDATEDDAQSEALEWGLRGREERDTERWKRDKELGVEEECL